MDDELAQKMAKQTLSPLENFLLFKLENKSRELDAANGEIEKLWSELDQFLSVSSPTATTPKTAEEPAPAAAAEKEPAPAREPEPEPTLSNRERELEAQQAAARVEEIRKLAIAAAEAEAEAQAEAEMLAYMTTCKESALPPQKSIYGIQGYEAAWKKPS